MPERIPLISVQVPVRDPGPGFAVFLGSLAVQETCGIPWELVLVDDGSDPPVTGVSLDGAGDCTGTTVVRLEGPGCRPRARNAALAASRAPLCLMADADLRFAPDALRRHVTDRGGADVLRGVRINAWSPDSTPWQKWFDTRAGGSGGARRPSPWRHFVTGNASLTAELVRRAGGFDESMTGYGGEDTELGWRLHGEGASFLLDPSIVSLHLDQVDVRRHSAKMHEYGATGLRQTLAAHPGMPGILGTRWLARPLPRAAVRAALSRPLYRAALRWAEIFGFPHALFTYLSVGGCLRGYMGWSP